jgi:hypothetical protein
MKRILRSKNLKRTSLAPSILEETLAFCLTSKMSHGLRWRATCSMTIRNPELHIEIREIARGVTAKDVGSGALLGIGLGWASGTEYTESSIGKHTLRVN